jgi:hypothetical protein
MEYHHKGSRQRGELAVGNGATGSQRSREGHDEESHEHDGRNYDPFDEDLAIEVFRAIAENPNIQKFRKDVYVWFPPLAWTYLIAGTTSILEMDLGLGLGFPVYDGHGFPVQAFASNQSLVDLEVHGVYDILDPLLFQLHSHPTLRKLTVTFCAITASYLPRMDWRT